MRSDVFVPPTFATPSSSSSGGTVLYADARASDDGDADGSKSKPFRSIAVALAAVANVPAEQRPVTLLLRGGTYRVPTTVFLGQQHSNLTIQNYGDSFFIF